MTVPLLEMQQIRKSFGGSVALDGVSFEVLPGEVHALVGENGAGKSTLMNIASGVLQPDAGRILWQGRALPALDPRKARQLGIAFVHQELALVPQLSIAENIFLGRHAQGPPALVRWGRMRDHARQLLAELGRPLDPDSPVASLGVGEQQLVEIARALAFQARLVIMDEPTAALSESEVARLFQVIARLERRGVSVVYITHRLREIYQIARRVTVLRDGRRVASAPIAAMPHDELIRHIVGRPAQEQFPPPGPPPRGPCALRVERLTARGRFQDVSFHVRAGEIVGLAGLVGAGRTELLEAIFGAAPFDAGQIWLQERPVRIRSPRDAIRLGMALVPDDRKMKGLIPRAPVVWNLVLPSCRRFLLRPAEERSRALALIGDLRIRPADAHIPVSSLSGGNQQKVVLARWLLARASVFLMDEPTRGIDVGAKAEIYELIRRLAERGAAIVLVSSEWEEILGLADRVLVMHRGRMVGELPREQATEEAIMRLATGGVP
ncbi:MAG: sugar ABC transporter ATP-binding protein [Bryobacterales bacterium]|nr:sugar ABC transporter ATP-binding protein [Bryobacteraceae bacterium]MDW8131696.1 sugar ABC transporter ATP-binding protein [Bryobacterales bacterium]